MQKQRTLTSETLTGLSRPITTKDVAELAGVNRASVSVVLNGAKSSLTVSDETRARIQEAAEKLGYRRNAMAAAFRSGHFGSIALMLSSHQHASTLPICVLNGIQDEVEARGVHLIVHRLPVATLNDPVRLPKVLREWSCDGLLVDMTHAITAEMRAAIATAQIPSIWFNVPNAFDAVRPDDFQAGRQAASHLLALGHKRICYMDLTHFRSKIPEPGVLTGEHYSVYDRWQGVKTEVEAAGLELSTCFRPEGLSIENPRHYFESLCEAIRQTIREHKPTAIISYGEQDFARFAVARDLGLRIPEDLSLVCFGAVPMFFQGYHLTQMAVPEYEMGQELVRCLFQKIEHPEKPLPTRVLPFQLDPGDTMGRPPLD